MRETIPRFTKFMKPDTSGQFIGWAATFGGEPDSYGDVIDHGAFAESLAKHAAKDTVPAMLWSHDVQQPIGRWWELHETDVGLEARGELTLEVTRAKDAHALMRANALGLSIGFIPVKSKKIDGINHLQQIDLIEISAVAIPANSGARITEVKSALLESPREFERTVRDVLGLSARQAKRLAAEGWSGLAARDEPALPQHDLLALATQLQTITRSLRKN